MRTTIAATSGMVVERPGRLVFEPSYCLATSLRYQPQDRVGCHDAGDRREVTTAEDLAFYGETQSLVVGQTQWSGTVRCAEDPVLLEQVFNDRLLVSIDPAREQQDTKASGGGSESMARV